MAAKRLWWSRVNRRAGAETGGHGAGGTRRHLPPQAERCPPHAIQWLQDGVNSNDGHRKPRHSAVKALGFFCSHNLPFQNPVSGVKPGGCKERGACVCQCRQDMGHFAFCATGLSLQKQEHFTEDWCQTPLIPSSGTGRAAGGRQHPTGPAPWAHPSRVPAAPWLLPDRGWGLCRTQDKAIPLQPLCVTGGEVLFWLLPAFLHYVVFPKEMPASYTPPIFIQMQHCKYELEGFMR